MGAPKQTGEHAAYKLTVRFEVRKVMVATWADDESGAPLPAPPGWGGAERWTDERLSIEDTFDLAGSLELSAVLGIIDEVGAIVRQHRSE